MSIADTISTDHELEKRIFTQEENYRAYKLFSMMDVDSGGSISLRELYRVLMGDAIRYVSCDFNHPDTGIVWGLDEESCVAIVQMEEGSLALNFPFLIQRMRLHTINGQVIPQHDPKSLELVYSTLLRLHDDPVSLEFLEPIIVINKFTCVLDMEVGSQVFSIGLPVGAVYNLNVFKKNLTKEMVRVSASLKHIKVDFFPRKRQIFFKCRQHPFRLLFLSGPNNRRSCRYALGFSAEDTPLAHYIIGQPMLIDLNLGLDRAQTEILMEELFSKFDRDGSGEFEFEEFRDFYIRYLDTDESLEYLRKYAKHRFRDIEHEKRVRKEQLERENRARRRAYMKVKYHDLIEAQKVKFKENSHTDRYGNRRRVYKHRPGFSQTADAKEKKKHRHRDRGDAVELGVEDREDTGEGEEDEGSPFSDVDGGDDLDDDEQTTLYGGSPAMKVHSPALLPPVQSVRVQSLQASQRLLRQDSAVTDPTAEPGVSAEEQSFASGDPVSRKEAAKNLRIAVQNGTISPEEAREIRRETAKKRLEQKQLRQKLRRKQILKTILEANKALNRAEKADAKKFKENNTNMYLMEAHCVIKRALLKSFRMQGTDFEGTNEVSWDVSHVVATPAVQIDSAILGLAVDLDNVNVVDMESKLLHPAALKYFFIRESRKKNAEFNAKVCHPAFFSSDFERQPSRNSRIAQSIVKLISSERLIGETYRTERGLHRITAVPPEDALPDKNADQPKKVRFMIDYKAPVSAATVVARLTVLTARVEGLPSIHLVEDNSPFVKLQCGQFLFATEINSLAGSRSMWDDLNWLFRLHHGDTLTLTVLSGTAAKNKVIGDFSLSAQDITALSLDEDRRACIKGRLLDKGERCGSIEVDIFVELGSEWDWHVAQYKKEQDRIYTKQHAIKKFSRTFQGEEDVPSFPLAITITGLTLLDLKSMHRLKNNRPYVELSCGTTQERTSVMENVLDSCAWQDVRWRVTLVSENANLIFLVFSEKLPMGRFILSGDELMRLHRNKHSYTEVMGDVKLDEEFTGKISFRCKLHTSTDASTLLSSASYTEGSIALDEPSVKADYSQDVKLPAVVTLHSVELAELPAVSSLKANSPQVVLTCGHFSSTTVPRMNSGSAAAWDSMGVSFPVQDKLHIEWKVFSGFVELGTMVLRAAELVKIARDGRSGAQVITRDLHNGKDVCGKVRVVLTYSLEGRNYTVGKQLAKLQQLAYKEPTIAGYGALPLSESVSSINETTEVVVDRYSSVAGSVLLQDSKAVDPSLFPLRLTVTDILANDLRSAHLLVKNSPSVRVVCGTVSATTKEVPRAGNSAIWSGLTMVVFLHEAASVRVSVFSKTVCIGFHTLECAQILDCTPDLGGNREAFVTICDEEGKTSGKLKVTFVLELVGSYVVPPLPFDTSEIRKGLDFPLLVTVRTLSLISLRKVHRYSSNSPFVKASCGAWQSATTVLDYAGRDAKWRDMNWEFALHSDTPLRLVVQSGTIVIGTIQLLPDRILEQNPNNQGLCELTGTLLDSEGRTLDAGQVRIAYSYEAHIDENSVNSDSDSDLSDVGVGERAVANNFLTLNSASGTLSETGKSNTARSIGHIHLLSLWADRLPAVHSLAPNSPYLKISCDDYRAVTTTLYRVSGKAEWRDLLVSFGVTRQSAIRISAMSGQALIGELSVDVKALLVKPTNEAGHVEYTASLFQDGKLAGTVGMMLHVDRLNRLGFGQSSTLLGGTAQGEESLELDAKTYRSHDIAASPVAIPFVLRIVRIIGVDIHPDLRRYFEEGVAVRVKLDNWVRVTPSCPVSGPAVNLAEWVDNAWVFVVTNPAVPLEVAVLSGNNIVGDLRIAMADVVSSPPTPRGLVELPLYLFRGQLPCGKVKVCLTIAPYESPQQQQLDFTADAGLRPKTPSRIVGFLRIKYMKVADLHQVYGLFLNSPKVTVSLGSWRASTPVAQDAGSDCTWDDLHWGRIPISEDATFVAKVTSGNESLGAFQISALDLFAIARKMGDTSAVLVEGDILDGSVNKGRFEMQCIPTPSVEDLEEVETELGEDAGVGAQRSWVSSSEGELAGDPVDPIVAPRTPRQAGLSASTPTPAITVVSFIGISVFDLKPLSAVFRNSPVVQLLCEDWKNETTVAKFAGVSADWILKHTAAWEVSMHANTFLKLSVLSNGAYIGTVCVSTRELIEVPRDSQGLTCIVRDLEHNLELTGRVRLVTNLTLKAEDPEKIKVSVPSLLTNSFGLPSLASYYPIEKKPSVSNSVIKAGVRGVQPGTMVPTNATELSLPVNVHISSASCDGVAVSLVASANSLSLVVKLGGYPVQRSHEATIVDRHVEWADLSWDIPVLSNTHSLDISVQSSITYFGEASLSIAELLSAPRTSQGFVEITRSLKALKGNAGKLRLSILLTPYLSPAERELYAQQIEEELRAEISVLQKLATLHINLVSVIDVSPLHRSLALACSIGEFSAKDRLTYNLAGSAVWGNLLWSDIELLERTHVVLAVSSGEEVVGKVLFTAQELLSMPLDSDGQAVVYGELLDGMAYRGTVSMTYQLQEPYKTAQTILGDDFCAVPVATPTTPAQPLRMLSAVVIHSISAKALKPVHKVGKNSPMVKLEYRGLKVQSSSLPYAGNKAEWSDLLWSIDAAPITKIRVTLTSGSAIIGAAAFSSQQLLDQIEGKNDAFLTLDLLKNNVFMGTATLLFRGEYSLAAGVDDPIESPDRVFHVPDNPHYIAASDAGDSPVGRPVPGPTDSPHRASAEGDELDENIELFRTHHRAPDDASIQSQRSAASLTSASVGGSGQSSWAESVSHAGSHSTASALRLPSVMEGVPLLTPAGEILASGRSSARSDASAACAGSSRPKTSRGAEDEDLATPSIAAPRNKFEKPPRSQTSTVSGSNSSFLSAGSESGSNASFSLDTVNSSYVNHSADLGDHRDRSIHTIHEAASGSSSVHSRSWQGNSSHSADSSTAFDSSATSSSPGYSLDRSIYSPSNSLSSSAASFSPDSRSRSQPSQSMSLSVFGTELGSSLSQAPLSLSTDSVDTLSRSVDRSFKQPGSGTSSVSSQSGALSPQTQSASVSSRSQNDSAPERSLSLASYGTGSSLTGAASSHFASSVSGNTASFLLSARSGGVQSSHTSQSRANVPVHVTAQTGPLVLPVPKVAWKGADNSTIATESDFSFAEEMSETGSESASSYSSEYSADPSKEARTIFSGYHSNLRDDSEQFSDYSETSSRSRSSYSAGSSRSGDWAQDTPRSECSDVSHSSLASSQYSTDSTRSQAGLLLPHGQTTLPMPLTTTTRASAGIAALEPRTVLVAPKRQFDISHLQWVHSAAPSHEVVAFFADRMVGGLLRGVVESFVAADTGGDFAAPDASGRPGFLTFHSDRRRIIRDFAFHVTKEVLMQAGSAVLHQLAASTGPPAAELQVTAGTRESTRNPFLDGTFKKRAGVTLTGDATALRALLPSRGNGEDGVDSDDDPIFGGLGQRGKYDCEVPQKARITFLDILGIDLSFLDSRVMPKRPYLTACKPYGNWAAETDPAWRSLDGKASADLVLNWRDLSGRLRWERFVMRLGQFLVLDLHDAGSGLIFAKGRLSYDTIINKHIATTSETVTVFVEFTVANEYGGGKLGGVARMHLDLSVNVFVRTKKSADFWDTHRSEHWTSFPIAPISTGTVRQKYREIAAEYDAQMVVHPSLFGFRARWRGNPEDEARFTHPIFRGFTLTKKPVPKKLSSELSKGMQKGAKPNPWRWDPNAAALGRCPVCTDGVSGCPRCFMLPLHKTGFPSTVDEYAYDPEREREKQRVAEQKEITRAVKRKRRMERMKLSAVTGTFEEGSLGSLSAEHDSDEEDDRSEFTSTGAHYANVNDESMTLHTNLTTYKSIRAYRNTVQKLLTVFVKLVPTGYVRKFVVDSTDTVFHMYNMYNSHSNYGSAHSSMLLIPTIAGMFELHPELAVENDLLMAVTRGRDTLGDYGLKERSSTVVMLFIPNYKKEYVPRYLMTYFEKNTDFVLPHLPTFDSVEHLPRDIPGDVTQKYLKGILELEYAKQQSSLLKEFIQRGLSYHRSRDAQIALNMKKMKERSQEALKEKAAMKLRLESQLKGLTGAERKAAKIALKKRELDKKRSVLYELEKAQHDVEKSHDSVQARKLRSGGTAVGRPESSRSASSDATSATEISFDDASTDLSAESESGDSSGGGSSSDSSSGDSDSSEEAQEQDGPDPESTPIPLSPRGRPASARSDASSASAMSKHRFYLVDDNSGRPGGSAESSVVSSSYVSFGGDTSLTPRHASSQMSSVTGLPSSTDKSDDASTASYDSYSSYTSASDGTYTSRSVDTHASSYYTEGSYTERSGSDGGSHYTDYYSHSSQSGSRPASASSTASFYSLGSGSSAFYSLDSASSAGTGSYASYDSYGSYPSSTSSYSSSSSATGQPYHQGSSLHSFYSGLSEPPSMHSSQVSRTVATLYSDMPPSLGSVTDSSTVTRSLEDATQSGGSYTTYTSLGDSQPSSARGSESTGGGLFTHRSALDSIASSQSALDSARSGNDSSLASSVGWGSSSRPSSASHSTVSDSTYFSAVSAVSDASSYTAYPSQSQSLSQSQSQSLSQSQSQSRGAGSDSDQRTRQTLFSADYTATDSSSYSTRSGSYTSASYPSTHSATSASSSWRSGYSESTTSVSATSAGGASSYIDDISMYSSEVRSRTLGLEESSAQQTDDSSEVSGHSQLSASVHSLFSEDSTANTYPSGSRHRHNQFPVPTARFQASQESLRGRFEKMRRAREELQQRQFDVVHPSPSIVSEDGGESSSQSAPVLVSRYYADGSPVRIRGKVPAARRGPAEGASIASDSLAETSLVGSDSARSYDTADSRHSHSTGSYSTASSITGARSRSVGGSSVRSPASASTYASERQKRRLMQPHLQRIQQRHSSHDASSEESSSYLSEGSEDSDSVYSDDSSYTADSYVTADSTLSASTFQSTSQASVTQRSGGFVQRKRGHLQQARSYGDGSSMGSEQHSTGSATEFSADPLGSHILSQDSLSFSHQGSSSGVQSVLSAGSSVFYAVSEDSSTSVPAGPAPDTSQSTFDHSELSSVQSSSISAQSSYRDVFVPHDSSSGSDLHRRPQHSHDRSFSTNSSMQTLSHQENSESRSFRSLDTSRSSSSSGTVDYLFRSDVLSTAAEDEDDSEFDIEDESDVDSWANGPSDKRHAVVRK